MNRKVAVLAVGTELTEGQVVNRNASWLSEQLVKLGFEILYHLTVPDDRTLILEKLRQCEAETGLIFVTGGLGPTTDDFTREVIAQWLGEELEFHPASWKRIEGKLQARGARVLEAHRSQAFFPKSADILENSAGTAEGFSVSRGEATRLWALPGPPREIEAIWSGGVGAFLEQLIPPSERTRLLTWSCIGKGESEIAELVEPAVKGSALRVGYRLNAPYVEVKVWCREDQLAAQKAWIERVNQVLQPWLISRTGENLAEIFTHSLPENAFLLDAATDGLLAERLNPVLRKQSEATLSLTTYYKSLTQAPEDWVRDQLLQASNNTFAVAGFSEEGRWAAGYKIAGAIAVQSWPPVVRRSWWTERGRKVVCELALKYWSEKLVSLP